MGAWPQRKKLVANPPVKKNRYTKKIDSSTHRSVPKVKTRDRQALEGNSLQPIRSSEQHVEINDYS